MTHFESSVPYFWLKNKTQPYGQIVGCIQLYVAYIIGYMACIRAKKVTDFVLGGMDNTHDGSFFFYLRDHPKGSFAVYIPISKSAPGSNRS